MSKVFVIPDVHLKTWMFKRATELIQKGDYDTIIMLGDLVDDLDSAEVEVVEGSSKTSANSEAISAIEELWKKAVEYVNKGDREGFYSDLFVNGQEGEWNDDYRSIENYIEKETIRQFWRLN